MFGILFKTVSVLGRRGTDTWEAEIGRSQRLGRLKMPV